MTQPESRWASGQEAQNQVNEDIWNRAVKAAILISTFTKTSTESPAEGVAALAIALTIRATNDTAKGVTEAEALEGAINIVRATHRMLLARRGEREQRKRS